VIIIFCVITHTLSISLLWQQEACQNRLSRLLIHILLETDQRLSLILCQPQSLQLTRAEGRWQVLQPKQHKNTSWILLHFISNAFQWLTWLQPRDVYKTLSHKTETRPRRPTFKTETLNPQDRDVPFSQKLSRPRWDRDVEPSRPRPINQSINQSIVDLYSA